MNHPASTAFQQNYSNTISNISFGGYRSIVDHRTCSWNRDLKARFEELLRLPTGWDGYDGKPLSADCFSFTQSIFNSLCIEGVPAPQLVPGADGSIQFEWHMRGYDIEVDVLGVFEVVAYRRNVQNDQELEIEVQKDFSIVAEWISELADAVEPDAELVA